MGNFLANLRKSTPDIATVTDLTSNTAAFVPGLRLGQGQSPPVQQNIISPGQFFFATPDVLHTVPLGTRSREGDFSVEVIYLAYRPHALLLNNNKVELESFEPQSPDFMRIRGMKKESGGKIAPLWGIDVLYFIPANQFDFQNVRDRKGRKNWTDKHTQDLERLEAACMNGTAGAYFYHSTARRNCPVSGSLVAGQRLQIVSELVGSNDRAWYTPAHHIALGKPEDSEPILEPFIQQSGSEMVVTNFLNPSQGAEKVVDAPPSKSGWER